MRSFSLFALTILGAALSALAPPEAAVAAAQPLQLTPAVFNASVTGFKAGRSEMDVTLDGQQQAIPLSVPNAKLQQQLFPALPGDEVQIVVDDAVHPKTVTGLNSLTRPVPKWRVVAALAAAIALLYVGTSAILGRRDMRAWLLGVDKRYSNSQTQLALWFGAVATIYIATNFLRAFCIGVDYVGGISLTTNLIALTGFSAFTFGAAKLITSQKVADAQTKPQTQGAPPLLEGQQSLVGDVAPPPAVVPDPKAPRPDETSLTNLVQNDQNQPDLGDLEMILITLAAVAIFLVQSFWWLTDLQITAQVTLPDVDNALLSSFGLGQGAYLFKKAALPVGKG